MPPLSFRWAVASIAIAAPLCVSAQDLGLFDASADLGQPSQAGAAEHADGVYTVSGSGENMWFSRDAFHFVYKRVEPGDVTLAADIAWVGEGSHEHRKACLLVRQSLEADSAYADAVLHGDGLASLQCRTARGATTHEVQSNATGPARLRIQRRGKYVSMSVSGPDGSLVPAGGVIRLELEGAFYVGLGVCSHDDDRLETARFSKVVLDRPEPVDPEEAVLHSTLETIDLASTDRRVVYRRTGHFEAPNWSPDGESFVFNADGKLYRLPVGGGEPHEINTGFAQRCNNDHGYSPDGELLVISDQTDENWQSRIYTLPAAGLAPGEEPHLVTENAPSYWHGWSPDGKTLAYCAERDGEYDLYAIPAAGGAETRLTDTPGLDDGPDYSPDGRHIYFNSIRTGVMQVWRINADGGEPTQITHDRRQNWFPHPSPDGRWIAYLSYEPHVEGHPANQDVELRVLPTSGGEPRTIATLFGGQGTINVPSWSPDSRRLAFVSYQLLAP